MKKMKLIIAALLAAAVVAVPLTACGASDTEPTTPASSAAESKTEESKTEESKTEESKPEESKPEESKPEDEDDDEDEDESEVYTFGDYDFEYLDASVRTIDGEEMLAVRYVYTNNSEKSDSAGFSLMIKAFQDGVELDTPIFVLDGTEEYDNRFKDVQPGTSITCVDYFQLGDTSKDVDLEISELISFDDNVLKMTVELN